MYVLQTLSFMQIPPQHLASDASNTMLQVRCLSWAFTEFKILLLLNAKICLYSRTRPCWPLFQEGDFVNFCLVAAMAESWSCQ